MTDTPSREYQTPLSEVDEFLSMPLETPHPEEYESESRKQERELRERLSPEEYRVAATAALKHYYDLVSTGKLERIQFVTMGFNPDKPLNSGVLTLVKIITAMERAEN